MIGLSRLFGRFEQDAPLRSDSIITGFMIFISDFAPHNFWINFENAFFKEKILNFGNGLLKNDGELMLFKIIG